MVVSAAAVLLLARLHIV